MHRCFYYGAESAVIAPVLRKNKMATADVAEDAMAEKSSYDFSYSSTTTEGSGTLESVDEMVRALNF